jgi:hypothetical protein
MILVEGAIEGDLAEPERLNGLAALVELSLVKHDPFAAFAGRPRLRSCR